MNWLRTAMACAFVLSSLRAQTWPQWGQNAQHTGNVAVSGQFPSRQIADFLYDPFVAAEQMDAGGDLLVHYQAALVDNDDVFMVVKTGQWIPCDPPGSGNPAPCGSAAWNSQVWNAVRLHWEGEALVERWRFPSDWKPEPDLGHLGGWEPVFHPVLAGDFVYVPGAGGTVFKLNREDGSVAARFNLFDHIDSKTFVAGPLTSDTTGNVYYNALRLDADNPWGADIMGAWLTRIGADDSVAAASWDSLTAGAPLGNQRCFGTFSSNQLPWPPSPSALPPTRPCGSQRPGLNVAPAIAPDGTIYTLSRAHFADRYGYLVAVNPDLTSKWTSSLRDRLSDGCGSAILPPNGEPGGCRGGANPGVDPATNQAPAGRVTDQSSSSPVIAPDGSILYGALTRYNYDRGHLMQFNPSGDFVGSYDFGWDTTPAVYPHGGTYSIILKDNHYDAGTYCADSSFCPPSPPGPYLITSLTADLRPEWSFQNQNTQSCLRNDDGSLSCTSDHPAGFEWCINAPAVDGNGTVYAASEDGNLYVIGQGGELIGSLFLRSALGAAYTPLSLGPDGKIYAQNSGHLLIVGN